VTTASTNLRAAIPTRLGRYEVRAKIGEGGMATVYLGHGRSEAGQDRVVALKVIKDEFALNPDFVNMFNDESKIVSRLNHPNVVRIFERGTEGARLFLAMELLFGQSLWQVWNACRQKGVRLRYDVAAWIGARVAEGLHHAHELRSEDGTSAKLVHRDINASNIFITYDGDVKIIDFGLAKAIGRISKTAAGVVKGKLAYMSPEQAVGKPLDRRSDLFALGTTLWEITADERLFKGSDDIETLKKVYAAVIPNPCELVEGYPPALWGVLQKALAREAKDRYSTGAQMAKDLDAVAYAEAKDVGKGLVGEVMRSLFKGERERQQEWISEASKPERPPEPPKKEDPLGKTLAMAGAPRLGGALTPAPPKAQEELANSGLFSGPALTLRDPSMAARQEATAPPEGITKKDLERIQMAAAAPFATNPGDPNTSPEPPGAYPDVPMPRALSRPDRGAPKDPAPTQPAKGAAGVVVLVVALLAVLAIGLWWVAR
jgi:serine/threonine-protein kinase